MLGTELENMALVDQWHANELGGHLRVVGKVFYLVSVWVLTHCLLGCLSCSLSFFFYWVVVGTSLALYCRVLIRFGKSFTTTSLSANLHLLSLK